MFFILLKLFNICLLINIISDLKSHPKSYYVIMFYSYDNEFFKNIIKPKITPPKWVFRYIWTVLFILMLTSFIIVTVKPVSMTKYACITVFFSQLSINFYWTKVFFKEHNIKKAFVIAIILTFLVLAMIVLFFKLSFWAGFLQIPYLFWLCFACVLNKVLLDLNK